MTQVMKSWIDGATWVGQGTVINNGAISDVSIIITPAPGNEMMLLVGSISHNDATASTITVLIRDADDNTIIELANQAAVNQNAIIQVPPRGTSTGAAGNIVQLTHPIMISSGMDLIMTAETIDEGEGITWSCLARTISTKPILTTVGGGAETVTTNTDLVF